MPFLRISNALRDLEERDLISNYEELIKRGKIKCDNLSAERFNRRPIKVEGAGVRIFARSGSKLKDGIIVLRGTFRKGLGKRRVYFGFKVKDGDIGDCLGVVDEENAGVRELNSKFKFDDAISDEIYFYNGNKRKIEAQLKEKEELPAKIEDILKVKPKEVEPEEKEDIRFVEKLHKIEDTLRKRPSEEIEKKIEIYIDECERLMKEQEELSKTLRSIQGSVREKLKEIANEVYKLNEDNKDVTYQIGDRLVQIRTNVIEKKIGLTDRQILNYLSQLSDVSETIKKLKDVVVLVKGELEKEVIIEKKPKEEKKAQLLEGIDKKEVLSLLLEGVKGLFKEVNEKLLKLSDKVDELFNLTESVRVPSVPAGEVSLSPAFASYNKSEFLPVARYASKKNKGSILSDIIEKWNRYELDNNDLKEIIE